jgi:hypothetical protein
MGGGNIYAAGLKMGFENRFDFKTVSSLDNRDD